MTIDVFFTDEFETLTAAQQAALEEEDLYLRGTDPEYFAEHYVRDDTNLADCDDFDDDDLKTDIDDIFD